MGGLPLRRKTEFRFWSVMGPLFILGSAAGVINALF